MSAAAAFAGSSFAPGCRYPGEKARSARLENFGGSALIVEPHGLVDRAIVDQVAMLHQEGARAPGSKNVSIVGGDDHDARSVGEPAEALLGTLHEARVAGADQLVEEQNVGGDARHDGE